VAIADPKLGLGLLRQAKAAGKGSPPVLARKGAKITVEAALRSGSRGMVSANLGAARIIESNLDRIKKATGVTDAEVIRIPRSSGSRTD
jgi:protein-arginine deiminase